MRYIIGVDVGGTNIKGVLIDQKGKILEKIIKKTSQTKIREEIILCIEEIIKKSQIQREKIKGVGIGFPGIIDKKRERIDILPNIKKFRDNNIKKYLESKTGFNIKIENDSNCAVLAESIFGTGKNYENIVGLSIGTGIGGGIVKNKKINLTIGEKHD
ncbi:MAG: ROK family protein [Minisyncoccales bacterium]